MTFTNIKTVIWDLDNTLYPYTEGQIENWHEAAVRSAIQLGATLDMKKGMQMARQSFEQYNYSSKIFELEYDICPKVMHYTLNRGIDETILPVCGLTPAAFENAPHLTHIILTHAHKDWAERVLKHIGLRDFFETKHILGLEDYDFKVKHDSNHGITYALDLVGGAMKDTVFAEDNLSNLEMGKKAGIHTAHVHQGKWC